MTAVDDSVFDKAFFNAHTFNRYQSKPVSDETLHRLYELLKWGPTAANCQPGRFLFIRSPEAKARLLPAVNGGNVAKVQSAAVTAIVATDPLFYDRLPALYPAAPAMREMFANDAAAARETAFRSGALQAAYLIIAARLLGLDCGPMTGFDATRVDTEFFAESGWRAEMLINLGYGEPGGFHPRNARLGFDEAARIL